MTIRARGRFRGKRIKSGGQTSPTEAEVAWGPNFGGVDGDKLDTEANILLPTLELAGNLTNNILAVATDLSLQGNLQSQLNLALNDLAFLGNLNSTINLDFLMDLVGNLNNLGQITLNDLSLLGLLSNSVGLTIPEISLKGNLNETSQISSLTFTTNEIMASKDSYVPTATTVGSCNDNANKNGQDLRVGNVTLVENIPRIYMGWNLTGLPAGATITQALLKIKPTSAPALAHNYSLFAIDAVNEGWNETTIVCNNAPANVNPNMSFNQPTNSNELTINITSTFGTYIQGRMGSANTCTLIIADSQATGQIQVYESKDQGTNNNLGPRLQLTFTLPT